MEEKAMQAILNPPGKKGQFLWKDSTSQKRYVESLKKKISTGYYFSEKVISRVVEEIAPVFEETVSIGQTGKYP